MQRPASAKSQKWAKEEEEEERDEAYDEYEGGEEGGYYGSYDGDGAEANGDEYQYEGYEDGEEGVPQRGGHTATKSGRRQLTESEEEDLEAEEELDADDDDAGVSYEEYLAKKKKQSSTSVAGLALPPVRKANEGRHLVINPKAAVDMDEESFVKQMVSYVPALPAPAMRWAEMEMDAEGPRPRAFHAACTVQLPGRPACFAIHGGGSVQLENDLWFYFPATDTWKRRAFLGSPPPARQSHAMSFVPAPDPSQPSRLMLISGATNAGKDTMVYVLTFGAKEEDGVWGYEHTACTNIQKLFQQCKTLLAVQDQTLAWCGCEEYIKKYPTPEHLSRHHMRPFFNRAAEEWSAVAFHSAVTAVGCVWVYGGKAAHKISGNHFIIPPPVPVCMTRVNTTIMINHNPVIFRRVESTDAYQVRIGSPGPAPLPPRYGHVGVYVNSRGMYIIGGNDGKKDLNDVWLLPYGGDWQREHYSGVLPPISGAAAAVYEQYIFIFGGRSGSHVLGNLFVYNTKDASVREIEVPGSPPCARTGHSMVIVDTNIYVFGGKDSNGKTLGDFFRLENVHDFTTRASLIGGDFLKELGDPKVHDAVIMTNDDKEIKVHRTFLAARCPKFRELLASLSSTSPVTTFSKDLLSADERTWRCVLSFLYSDTVTLSALDAPHVRALSLTLGLDQLVAICNRIERPTPVPPSRLMSDMKWLLDSGFLSDVELVAGGVAIKAHKNVLSSRCPFFKAMFQSKFKESTGARVEMNDMDAPMLQAVIEFLYCEVLNYKDYQLAFELLAQSDLLELPDLKNRCASILLGALNNDNAVVLYEAATMYNVTALADASFKYICQAIRESAGMDDDLIRSLSTSVFELVNKEREKLGLPMLVQREGSSRWTWNDICSKCSLPFSYTSTNNSAWPKPPKDLLVESCGPAHTSLKYERVLSLTSQVGHRAEVTLPNGTKVRPPLSRNTKRDAEQTAAAAAYHVLKCNALHLLQP